MCSYCYCYYYCNWGGSHKRRAIGINITVDRKPLTYKVCVYEQHRFKEIFS